MSVYENEETDKISKITDNIYLTSYRGASNFEEVKRLGIETIVTALEYNPFENSNEDLKFQYYYIEDEDNFNIKQFFDSFYELACENKRQNKKILIHCYSGRSRSATLVLSYMIREKFEKSKKVFLKYDLDRFLKIIKNKRSVVDPNDGFIRILESYIDDLKNG